MKLFVTELSLLNLNKIQALMSYPYYPIHLQLEWLNSYAELLQNQRPALFLTVGDTTGKLLGALLLEKIKVRGTRYFNLSKLIPFATGPSDFFDILCIPGHEKEVSIALVNWLKRYSQSWDSFQLDLIPESSNSWQTFVESLHTSFYQPIINNDHFFYKIKTNGEWDDYENQLHRHTRDLRNRLNRVKRDGIILRVDFFNANIVDYLNGFIQCYQQRRSIRNQINSFELLEGMERFIKAVIQDFESKRMVQLSLLFGNEDIWAYQLDWIDNGIWYHYMPTFDQRYEQYSPGKILLFETIREAFSRPEIHEFNFMRGQSPYKSQFAWDTERYISIYVDNQYSIRNKAVKVASYVTNIRDQLLNQIR